MPTQMHSIYLVRHAIAEERDEKIEFTGLAELSEHIAKLGTAFASKSPPGVFLLFQKRPAEHRRDTQHLEEARGDAQPRHTLAFALASHAIAGSGRILLPSGRGFAGTVTWHRDSSVSSRSARAPPRSQSGW